MELLAKDAVAARLGICERTLENLTRRGHFPPPVYLGKRAMWAREVVERWLEQKFARQMLWSQRSGIKQG